MTRWPASAFVWLRKSEGDDFRGFNAVQQGLGWDQSRAELGVRPMWLEAAVRAGILARTQSISKPRST